MSDYWKKKLDELNQSQKASYPTSKSTTSSSPSKSTSYWENALTEFQNEKKSSSTVGSTGKVSDKVTVGKLTRSSGGGSFGEKDYSSIVSTGNKKLEGLLTVSNNKDFNEKSGYVSTKSDRFWDKLSSKYGMGYTDLQYEYINNQKGVRDEISQRAMSWGADSGKTTSSYEEKALDYMTEDEVAVYNYYYQTEGKEKAQEFLDALEETLSLRKATNDFSNIKGKTGREIAYGIVSGSHQFEQGTKNLANMVVGSDDYIPQTATQILTGMVREDLVDDGFKVLGNSVGQVAFDALSTGSNMIPSIAVGAVNPFAGAALMGASAAGNAYQQDLNEGNDKDEARQYATTIGVLEGTLQYLLGGIGKLGGTSATVTRAVSGIKNGALRFALEYGGKIGSEALEEGLQEVLDPIVKNAVHGTDESVDWENVAYSALLGGLMGAGFGASEVSTSHLSNSEATVVNKVFKDKVAEEEAKQNGKKLSNREKNKIYDDVIRDLEKGYISTDTIAEVLGGKAYADYNALVKENDEFKALYDKEGISERQRDRLAELKAKNEKTPYETAIKEARKNLFKEGLNQSRNSRLAESYMEIARKKQDFTADLSKYESESAKKTLQNIIDSGLANNSNEFHDFVDLLTNISTERGTVFKITDNEGLKGTEHHKEGFITDGFITNDDGSITINLDSPKALNFIVGHEVTHSLEKQNSYNDLQEIAFQYAKDKGELEQIQNSVNSRYSDLDDAGKAKEVTADLIGRYLFTDYDFISNLSANHRNVFQKVFDEIKHLYKMATAGSKANRDLERLKHQFEKVLRENGAQKNTADGGVSYALESKKQPGRLDPRTVTKADVVDMLHKVEEGAISGNTYIPVRIGTPEKLIYWAEKRRGDVIDNNPIAISADKAYNAMDRSGETGTGRLNRLSPDEIVAMIESMNDPQYIVYQSANDRYVEVVKFDTKTGDKAFAVIEIGNNKDSVYMNGYEGGLYNILVTTYPPKSGKLKELLNAPSNEIIYDKNKDASQRTSSSTVPSVLNDASFYDDRLPDNSKEVKPQYSISESDNWSKIQEMQMEVNRLNDSIRKLESSQEYKNQMRKVEESLGSGNMDEAIESWNRWTEESGLEALFDKRKSLTEELGNLRKSAEEARANEALEEERKAIEKSGLSEADYFRKQAVKEFGYTPYFYDAGYIVSNGKMLNFSGEKGQHFGSRGQDHRAIGSIYAEINGTAALNRFVNDGNIRIVPESPGFDVSATIEPTKEQYATIRKFIYQYADKGYFSIDISDKDGRVVGSLNYENRINPTRIIADLKHYYETGEIRQPSALEGFRYSLSEDSSGREVSPAVAKRFANSKAVDEDGNLKVLYHGTASGEFNIFDKAKGSVEGDFGSGFYFTDNELDVSNNYEGGGPDFENKVARLAEQIEQDEDIDYEEAEERARAELFKGSHKFEVYLNIENPAVVGKTILFDGESYYEQFNEEDYDDYDDYIADMEQAVEDDISQIIWDVEQKVDVSGTLDELAGVLFEAYSNGGMGIEELKARVNDLYLEDNEGNLVGNEVTRQIIESLGYDGIIDPTVSGKWNMDMESGTTHYIVFKPNQIKDVANQNPTDNPDIHRSVSGDEGYKEYGNYNIYGKDVKVQSIEDLPIAETTSENATELPKTQLTDDKEDDIPIKTVAERLTAKRSNSQTELDNNRRHRAEATKSFDEKIAKAQAQLDAKKNKDTKVANNLRRRIERLQRLKADVDAQYAKRISDIESRLTKTDEELQKDHTKKDQYERTIARINRIFEMEKADLDTEFAQKREAIADKNSYISTKASELYKEIRGLKKGVKASEQLAYLLDHGYDWSSIRSALVNIKHTPGETVNINSEVESVAREMLNDDFEQAQYNLDSEYQSRLSDLESEAETKRESAKVANQRMEKHQEYAEQMENLIGDTTTWVDKKMGISYKVNTLRRNLRDIVRDTFGNRDIAKADAIYDELQGKYNHNEAMLHREANQIKKPYADLKITSAEDAYIQMLGEFRHNPDSELTADAVNEFYEANKDKINTDKVDKVIESARETYDNLLKRVNEVLREQGMKEIPYRQGYFPHFTEPKQNWLAKLLNWKVKDFDIPTDIAGLTENFNPNRSWQAFNKQRKSDTTDYSFMKGMDTYVQGALDWIYHIEDIQKRRAFENHIRYVHSEKGVQDRIDAIRKNTEYDADEMQEQIDLIYKEAGNPLNNFVTDFRAGTNTLANKKSSLDRGMEELVNRKVYSTMTNLSNRVTGNMVVGSFSSALTNFIPITQSWVEVSPVSSLRAMGDTIKSAVRDDGMIEKSDFLTNRLRQSDALFKTNWDKISDKAALMMEAVDSFTSQTVWRSKYLENISNGMSESEAIKNADQFAENVIAGRSRGNMPTIFDSKNPLIKTLTAFQLEVNNQYQYLLKDAPQEMKDKSVGRLIKGYATAFLGAYAYNALYSSLVGRDAAFDPIGIIEDLLKDLFGDDDDEEPSEIILGLTDSILEEVPFVGGLLGGGRIPISSALPYGGLYEAFTGTVEDVASEDWSNLTKEWMNPLYYLAMPLGGGQIRKTVQGLGMFDDDLPISGSYTSSGKLRYPVEDTFGNKVQAAMFGQYASENARDYFDNNRSALGEKQIQEFIDLDLPIRDYWDYREGLNGLSKLEEKADYIDSLDLPIDKKNLLINNIADREEPIDLTGYSNYGSFEEFEFAKKNPGKYKIAKTVGGYENYMTYKEAMKDMKLAEKVDYVASLNLTTKQKNALINGETDRKEPIDLTGYEEFDSFEEFEYYKDDPEGYAFTKAVGGYDAYKQYSADLNDIKADKDQYGKSISGSRKVKVLDYINSLDADYYTKLILYKSVYTSYDDENYEIIEYLNSRDDISFEEEVAILRKLGFNVTNDGKISW